MILKILLILICCYILIKYVALEVRNDIGKIINKKPIGGIIELIKQDAFGIKINDLTDVIVYIASWVCTLVTSPLILCTLVYHLINFKYAISLGFGNDMIKHLKEVDKDYFVRVFGVNENEI